MTLNRAVSLWVRRLWKQLVLEVKDGRQTSQDREESLLNFVRTPFYLERVILFGTLTCLDSFFYVLTIIPIRFFLAVISLVQNRRSWHHRLSDLIKGSIIILTLVGLSHLNTSRVYHGIRGQAGVTLFVMFSIFEVTDKFCCAIGQDIVDSLVSQPTSTSATRTILFALIALVYVASHSFVLLWQLVTLNVAVNSYSNALLSLMLTSQFSEVKGAVFKKIDLEQLFQLTCADITQRFQLAVMLAVIVLRNLLEPGPGTASKFNFAAFGPATMVNVSIILVDWLKHSYIGNFNDLRPGPTYNQFLQQLVSDYIERRKLSSHHLMIKSVGLPVLPLAIVCIRMFAKHSQATPAVILVLFLFLLVAKLALGLVLEDQASSFLKHQSSQKLTEKTLETQGLSIPIGNPPHATSTKYLSELPGESLPQSSLHQYSAAETSSAEVGHSRPAVKLVKV